MPFDVLALAHYLRSIGVAVSTGEVRDAQRALELVGPNHAERVLGMVLVKREEQRRALLSVASLFADGFGEVTDDALAHHLAELDSDALREFALGALRREDPHAIAATARALVDRHVTIQPGAPVAGSVHVIRAYRAVRPDLVQAELEADLSIEDTDPLAALRSRLWLREVERQMDALRQAIEKEVRRRLVHDRGSVSVAKAVRTSLPEDIDFLTASTAEIRGLDAALSTLPNRLERHLRLADARPPSGRLDARATLRRSMSTGGVPVRPAFHPRRPPRPELIVLADISGSVASFARFTLSLAHGLHRRFHSVRSFVFVDGIDEVTDLLRDVHDLRETAERIDRDHLGVHLDGRSDYGQVFRSFWEQWGHQLSPRSFVLVLGDARSNFRDAQADSLRAVSRRAGRLFWLNPERKATWRDGDSLISTYAPLCTGVYECRTIRQLEDFVVHRVR